MFKRILVPFDGSDTSRKALGAAIDMARMGAGRIRLVHQPADLSYLSAYDTSGGSAGELVKAMEESGQQLLDEGTARVRAAGIEAETMLLDPWQRRLGEAVADAATLWNADLIVLGTHGRRGVARALLGSGAEQIIRLAPVPVLAVR